MWFLQAIPKNGWIESLRLCNINDTINVNIKLNKTEKTILEIVINNPNITQSEIAEKLNITKVTVNRNINKLKVFIRTTQIKR